MKPGHTDYINFKIQNFGNDVNPVNVWKDLINIVGETGTQSEPECEAEAGKWDNQGKQCTGMQNEVNDLQRKILYDLYVEVYDAQGKSIWFQTIYLDSDGKTIEDVYGGAKNVFLGMIPANGYMEVKQSYHMNPKTGNEYQGDVMSFDIELYAEQLTGNALLENKTGDPDWNIIKDDFKGTLIYGVKNPTFDFDFKGKAPLAGEKYCLWIGGTPQAGSWDANTNIGCVTSGTQGEVDISGSSDLGKDVKDGKAWLILENDYDGTNWNAYSPASYLWETGLIWYDDTDL